MGSSKPPPPPELRPSLERQRSILQLGMSASSNTRHYTAHVTRPFAELCQAVLQKCVASNILPSTARSSVQMLQEQLKRPISQPAPVVSSADIVVTTPAAASPAIVFSHSFKQQALAQAQCRGGFWIRLSVHV